MVRNDRCVTALVNTLSLRVSHTDGISCYIFQQDIADNALSGHPVMEGQLVRDHQAFARRNSMAFRSFLFVHQSLLSTQGSRIISARYMINVIQHLAFDLHECNTDVAL